MAHFIKKGLLSRSKNCFTKSLIIILGFGLMAEVSLADDRDIEIDRLIGSHRMVLNWIGWKDDGYAHVLEVDGQMFINGFQENDNGETLFIQGKILDAAKNSFTFEGTIITRVSKMNGGNACIRTGVQQFKRINVNHRYWRMQEPLNPCTNIEQDYIDIYLRE